MSSTKKIKNALISVFSKDDLEPIVKRLNELDICIYSTGGTQAYIESLGVKVNPVENLTSYPSILGGRVKTLHPKVFGGILGRRETESDIAQLQEYGIPEIDLVIVDLYPFEETLASGASEDDIIEKIDIGGISLIRAAAKNYKDVVTISSKSEYSKLMELLESGDGESSVQDRKQFAQKAFAISSNYDTAILGFFTKAVSAKQGEEALGTKTNGVSVSKKLRYGENPHQDAIFVGNLDAMFDQLHGKELSYNNLLDIDAAVNLISDFSEPTFAILKHNNACGTASRNNLLEAWKDALAGDPISAFGGILICNREVQKDVAEEVNKLFFEVIIAPSYSNEALDVLEQKKNRIILIQKEVPLPKKLTRTALNGILEQDKDLKTDKIEDMLAVTNKVPSEDEKTDLEFACKLVKHSKSNTIVLAKGTQLLASGVGQTSRVDALEQAILKANKFGFSLEGAVMASDAFFPFPDCVEIAHEAGITAVIQPGGSIRDKDSIEYCNANNVAMVVTGVRHFKH
ncbi:MAG TPA: bifunctional phosphoribosylaminoimidazolecarboxamide formyltransferase/IMP cyclohydrolase [Flavobacteriales bacterium]|nr:bifunctional phosphoribosylaminoimidazolecarboxamide formyltransferase/IMP cyclohydrolase [Flavobacteriales bacterium]HIN39178.1 bifunctional phosphoribosylaminoimidazolecarboxamide formyltransferase/IMP cyclohydrolase [Flavobacteriales bacterium]